MFIRTVNANPALFVQEFDCYTSAAMACGDAYDHRAISELVVENTKSILSKHELRPEAGEGEHTSLAIPIAARNAKGTTRVLDFGGAAGLHAAMSLRTLSDVDQRWAIVETPSMVRACIGLATEKIQFFETIGDALSWLGEVDLVHCSETLHYLPDPIASLIELQSIGARVFLVQRSAVSMGRRVFALETFRYGDNSRSGSAAAVHENVLEIPTTYVNQNDFVASLCEGYSIAYAFNGRPYKTINNTEIEFGSAYLLQRE